MSWRHYYFRRWQWTGSKWVMAWQGTVSYKVTATNYDPGPWGYNAPLGGSACLTAEAAQRTKFDCDGPPTFMESYRWGGGQWNRSWSVINWEAPELLLGFDAVVCCKHAHQGVGQP